MSNRPSPQSSPKPAPRAPREQDWFYDELMTAQPDATGEFLRARLMLACRVMQRADVKR